MYNGFPDTEEGSHPKIKVWVVFKNILHFFDIFNRISPHRLFKYTFHASVTVFSFTNDLLLFSIMGSLLAT